MLVRLGARRGDDPDVVDLLLECHERIRKFTAMACALATAEARGDAELREAAVAVRRYFTDALPLHVADEDEDIAPALAGRDPQVDAALAALSAEHFAHVAEIERLVELCDDLIEEPSRRAAVAGELGGVAGRLRDQLAAHLEREERVVFPAIRALPEATRAALLERVRARRAVG